MAWTDPRTWVAGEQVTAALLNAQVRDNLDVLDQHDHDGTDGNGSPDLDEMDSITWGTTGDPATTGMLQKNSTDLKYYNGTSVINLTLTDAAAGTMSHRTLGTGALQGAIGSHVHP